MSDIILHPSPNHDERRGAYAGRAPGLVILHYTGMQDGGAALGRLCDPQAKVSAHYLVEEDGRIFALVPEARRAWHAGQSWWRGEEDINSASIGIEIVNPGHEWGYRPFPAQQMKAVRVLCQDLKARYGLSAAAFLGHSDVAPLRKDDPGELFDWQALACSGIGVWPPLLENPPVMAEPEAMRLLSAIGYDMRDPAMFAKVLMAFQRHYAPQDLVDGQAGILAPRTRAALAGMAGL